MNKFVTLFGCETLLQYLYSAVKSMKHWLTKCLQIKVKIMNSEKTPVAFEHRWHLIKCHLMLWLSYISKCPKTNFFPLYGSLKHEKSETGGFLSIITRVEPLYSANGHLRLLNCDSCSMKRATEWSSNALIHTEHY